MLRTIKFMVAALTLFVAGVPLAAETLVEIERVRPGDLESVGFELTKPAEVEIEAVGLPQSSNERMTVYAWILDSDTREPVWVMKSRGSDRYRSGVLRKVEKVKALDAGKYELYLYAGEGYYGNISFFGEKGGSWNLFGLFDGKYNRDYDDDDDCWFDDDDFEDLVRDSYVRLSSDEISKSDIKEFDVTGEFAGALVTHNQLGDEEYIRQAFRLDKQMSLRIYSVFEYPPENRNPVDLGWIINSGTREKVWELDRWNTDAAGGGKKNRMFDDEVELEKGDYILYFVTDDSHSFEYFNVRPPYDPCNWGITILPGQDFSRSAFKLMDLPKKEKPLVDLTRVRDDDYVEQAFKLDKETTFRVYAIGEYSTRDREFADYGWIEEAGRGKVIWEMKRRNTEYAGGGEKNRMFDGRVTLPAGEYVAVYVTDGSHAYRDWNVAAPYDPAAWGMAIFPGPDGGASNLKILSERDLKKDSDVLVQMTRVRDREHLRERFTLDKDTRVHIYAIGEGERGRMFDYAWIVDDRTDRAEWEMTWRSTDHAGGAKKNRVYDDEILLEKGTYVVHYETDGSHSFSDWNAKRPRDPHNYGITITRVP
ncbi:MAG: hypothetical protein DRP45_03925 [Candidatus Zixiibacteriota bacterium]|nr:MAG: hypothetical protein DRP45_03925 [candidate division Zixibacteria bacterium]